MGGIDGQLHHSDCAKANAFNGFFSRFVDEDPNTVPTFTRSRGDLPSLSCVEVTLAIVFEKLQSLKSTGPDGWPPIILEKLCRPVMCYFGYAVNQIP